MPCLDSAGAIGYPVTIKFKTHPGTGGRVVGYHGGPGAQVGNQPAAWAINIVRAAFCYPYTKKMGQKASPETTKEDHK